jgi:hypothetical protein
MPTRSIDEEENQSAPSVPRWKGSDSLDLVYRLNERSLQALKDLAASSVPSELPAVVRHRGLWSVLSHEALTRIARLPFIILDVHFRDDAWWRRVVGAGEEAANDSIPIEGGLPERIAEPLMQETLIFAWHTVKWDQRVARLSLGMSPGVAESIAVVTPQQLAGISGLHSRALRLRWDSEPDVWRELLRAATSDDQEALAEVHHHAKLLFCGGLISGRG